MAEDPCTAMVPAIAPLETSLQRAQRASATSPQFDPSGQRHRRTGPKVFGHASRSKSATSHSSGNSDNASSVDGDGSSLPRSTARSCAWAARKRFDRVSSQSTSVARLRRRLPLQASSTTSLCVSVTNAAVRRL